MAYIYYTNVPNELFDTYLHLDKVPLKVLMLIIRQTYGWIDPKTGSHKQWAWISIAFFVKKTNCSKRGIGMAIQLLVTKKLILVKNEYGTLVHTPEQRKHASKLYFKATLR